MWKKKEPEPIPSRPAAPPPPPSRPQPRSEAVASIGPSVVIRGEVAGQENLRIQGQIEGKVALKGQDVTVGRSGKVQADIHAKAIRIEGEVVGDLYGEQEIIIDASGQVTGNLVAPRVILENGSRFKGSIDMESAAQHTRVKPPRETPGADPGSETEKAPPGTAPQAPKPSTPQPEGDPRTPLGPRE